MKRKSRTKRIRTRNPSNKLLMVIGVFALLAAVLSFALWNTPAVEADVIVYKKASCQCCARWVTHLRDNNLRVRVINVQNTRRIQKELGVHPMLAACHTAVAGDYVIEGHVPADLIHRLLNEQPDARGLSVPGMPIGSPGMEGPKSEKYDVLLFDQHGNTNVYATRIGKQVGGGT